MSLAPGEDRLLEMVDAGVAAGQRDFLELVEHRRGRRVHRRHRSGRRMIGRSDSGIGTISGESGAEQLGAADAIGGGDLARDWA